MNAGSFVIDERPLRERHRFARLLRPVVGVMTRVGTVMSELGAPDFPIAHTDLGNMTYTMPHVSAANGQDAREEALGGAGADTDRELAWIRAVVEGAERYASMVFDEREFIVASARELGPAALDLTRIPCHSARELAHPAAPYEAVDLDAPIRWVRGWSLIDRCERLVPAAMTYIYFRPQPGENFWQMISTGVAAHTRLEHALVSAICESIERDAIALTWLLRLPLPRIDLDGPLPAELARNLGFAERSQVRHLFFDATTDLGIPTVYLLQLLEGNPKLAQFVGCATDFDPAAACAKTIREAAPSRAVFQLPRSRPSELADFSSLYDGAAELGLRRYRREFQFLIDSPRRRALDDLRIEQPGDGAGRLRVLLERLRAIGSDAVAIDLTTDELREAGLWAVRVVVPGLMPMSPVQRGRYLGTPRLYGYPAQAGYGTYTEDDINPAPQPFA
jgi:ribosomal protein S12 methylthiotransferase accessory factor